MVNVLPGINITSWQLPVRGESEPLLHDQDLVVVRDHHAPHTNQCMGIARHITLLRAV